jgi:hypothetical protein
LIKFQKAGKAEKKNSAGIPAKFSAEIRRISGISIPRIGTVAIFIKKVSILLNQNKSFDLLNRTLLYDRHSQLFYYT